MASYIPAFDYKSLKDSASALEILVKETRRPWYKKPEAWFALIAAITGLIILFKN
ncbi:MAG: hypothetical protein V1661_00815 [bacterium]